MESTMDGNKPVSITDARQQRDRKRYAALVLKAWNDQEHEDKRQFLDRKAEVEIKARERL